ncbi:MAG: ChaN family lipoprotein [Desulfobacteraceae bacterium]|nr:ChaN family lipoprotein [Desulfobacteraceae bacterium]
MRLLFFSILFSLVWLLLNACVVTTPKRPERIDPLIGSTINTQNLKPLTFDELVAEIIHFKVIYLSEKHDNSDQHQFQEKIIQAFLDKGKKPVIAFEFFSMEETPYLMNFIDSGKAKHRSQDEMVIEKDLRKKLFWENQSDEMWGYYFSLLNLARNNGLETAGIDLFNAIKRRITRKGLNNLTTIEKKQIFDSGFSNDVYKDHMFEIFKDAHCGMGHNLMQQRLYEAWIARNDKMALSITQINEKLKDTPIIVIIGAGHTEYGLGVVERVQALNPGIQQVNVGLQEITLHPSELESYTIPLALEGFQASAPYDFIRFFQRASYENPCEKFKKSLEKMKKSKK